MLYGTRATRYHGKVSRWDKLSSLAHERSSLLVFYRKKVKAFADLRLHMRLPVHVPRHLLKHTEGVCVTVLAASAQKAAATEWLRTEVKLDLCAQLLKAGS